MARSRQNQSDEVGLTPAPPGSPEAGSTGPDPMAGAATSSSLPTDPAGAPHSRRQDPALEVPHTRTSATYAGMAVGLVVLVLVIVFIAQNLGDASVHFFTAHFRLPLGLLILAAAVAGGLLVLLVSAARVAQLRLMARRHRAGKPTG